MIVKMIRLAMVIAAPFLIGIGLLPKRKVTGLREILKAWMLGTVCQWAAFQLMAVPMIWWKVPYAWLLGVYTVWTLGMMALGCWRLRGKTWQLQLQWDAPALSWVLLVCTAGLIFVQMWMYAAGMHLDQDDARWLAEANDILEHGTIYLHNPATGAYLGRLRGDLYKDLFSPWSAFWAVLSSWSGIRPAVMVHTLYAPMLLLLSYGVYALLAGELFAGRTERLVFLFSVAVINLFYAGSLYTQSVFTLTRIWQGKATVAAVIIPLILYWMQVIQREDTWRNWLLLMMIGCGSCLLSGMGIVIALIMIGGYGGYVVIRSRFRDLPKLIVALVPVAIFEVLYYLVRG